MNLGNAVSGASDQVKLNAARIMNARMEAGIAVVILLPILKYDVITAARLMQVKPKASRAVPPLVIGPSRL
jgi:hypothetical protein